MFRLIHGNEPFLSYKAAKNIFNDLVEKNPSFEAGIVEADTQEATKTADYYNTISIFSPGKVLLIKRLYKNKNKEQLIEDLIENIKSYSEHVHFIIWEEEKIKSNTRYYKLFKENDAVEEYDKLNKRAFTSWAKDTLKEFNLQSNTQALEELSYRTNFIPERFIKEIEKFQIKGTKDITVKEIEDTSSNTFEHDIWKLLDAINNQEKHNAIEIISKLLEQQIDANFMLAMIIRNTRMLILTKYMHDKGFDSRTICSELRIPPFTLPSIMSSAKNTTFDNLKRIYNKIYNLDSEIKSGNIEADLGVTLLTTAL